MIFNDFITYGVLPFMLIFVITFAILQKSKILGEKKNQIDALVSLVIALLLVAVPGPQKKIIVNLMPWLAVALSILLVFFILYGFVAGDLSDLPRWMKIVFGILILVFTAALVVNLTDINGLLQTWFGGASDWFVNLIILALVVGGIAWAVMSDKKN